MKKPHPSGITRFSVSLPQALGDELDDMVCHNGYESRSHAIAEMVRDRLVEHKEQDSNKEIAGTITLVYDHHKRNLQEIFTDIQHEHHESIVSSMHVHLDHDNCLEVLVVRGKSKTVRAIANTLIASTGVKHGKLTITTTGKERY
jgi:CopG family nickel-responsive transcriptional regulator